MKNYVQKGELMAITYSAMVKQIYKISKSTQELNQRLQKIGKEIGLRAADQYNDSSASRLNPADNVKAFIKGVVKSFLGLDMNLTYENIQFLKRQHLYDLQYTIKENHFADFVLLPQKMFDSVEERQCFNYLAILTGFICGALQTMKFSCKVRVEKDALQEIPEQQKNMEGLKMLLRDQSVIRINLQKQIKNDD